jgi:hypothetical protein
MIITFEMEARMAMEKLRLQQKIRDRFGDWQIEARRQSLCQRCISFDNQHCKYSLLPVTSEGSDCPYHQERQHDNTGPEGVAPFCSGVMA